MTPASGSAPRGEEGHRGVVLDTEANTLTVKLPDVLESYALYFGDKLVSAATPMGREMPPENLASLRARLVEMEAAIKRALADSESGKGWGPDVTVCAYLRAALEQT